VRNWRLLTVLAVAAGIAGYCFVRRVSHNVRPTSARPGPFPAEKLRAGRSRWAFLIEHSGAELTERDIRAAAPAELRSVPREREAKAREGVLRFFNIAAAEFEPPGERELQSRGRGLSAADFERVAALERATWIAMRIPSGPRARELLRATEEMAVRLARARHGFVWDAVTRELFTPEALEQRRLHPGALDVRDHVTIDVYGAGKLYRVVTRGMEKFGLPDLVVEHAANDEGVGQMVNLAAQLLVEGAGLSADGKIELDLDALSDPVVRNTMTGILLDGAMRKAEVTALAGRRDKRDPQNDLLELWFGEPAQVKQAEVASRIWGSKNETTVSQRDGTADTATEALPWAAAPY
jgi:hypothetical protein